MTAFLSASLYGNESGRIRRLKGFVKGAHFEPDSHSSAADGFVRRAGSPDIEERAESVYQHLRRAFAFRRRDLTYSFDAGIAAIGTPDFEIGLRVEQDPEEARGYRIETAVRAFTRPEVVAEDAFIEVFRPHCDTVLIEFPGTIDVAARIDALEDSSRLAGHLEYPPDASWLTIQAPGATVRMELHPHEVRFSVLPGGDLRQLIEGASRLLNEMHPAGLEPFLSRKT